MSAEVLKAKKQLNDVYGLLKQGKLLSAVRNLLEATQFVLRAQLLKHEFKAFQESLDKAAYFLANDQGLKKIYPLQILYKPGMEKELAQSLTELYSFLQENFQEELQVSMQSLEAKRQELWAKLEAAVAAGNSAEAERAARKVIETAPEDTDLKEAIADLFLDHGVLDLAIAMLKEAHAQNPESAHIFNKLAMTLRKAGHLEEAEQCYLHALTRAPKDEYLHFNLGRVYLDMRQWKRAMECADKALALNADFDEARKMRIYAQKQLQRA